MSILPSVEPGSPEVLISPYKEPGLLEKLTESRSGAGNVQGKRLVVSHSKEVVKES